MAVPLHTHVCAHTCPLECSPKHREQVGEPQGAQRFRERRILLANWFYNASVKALQGEAKRKYFEHAGALMTADGTDKDLIKLEGVPKGVELSF